MAGRVNFSIGGNQFTLVSLFNGKEQIVYNGQVVSERGNLIEQLTDRRVHDFELGGYKFHIVVTSRMGPKVFKEATVNGQKVEVIAGPAEVTPAKKAASTAMVLVIAPALIVAMSAWPMISTGKVTAVQIGGLIGGLLGCAATVAYGVYAKSKKA